MVVDDFPLSWLQQGLLYHHLSGPGQGVDIEQIIIDYKEALDLPILSRAWQLEMDRHPVLRTSFRWAGLDEPRQEVHDTVAISFEHQDAGDERTFQRFLADDRARGFDLSAPPVMRLTLFEFGPEHFRLVWTLHHILMDGRAFLVVLNDLEEQYRRLLRGESPIETAGPSYRPYVEWERSRDLSGAVDFWRSKLAGLEGPTPLPPDLLGGARDDVELVEVELSEAQAAACSRFASEHNVTLNSLVMGAWALLMARYSGERCVLFGAVKTSRGHSVPESNAGVGLFLETLPVRVDIPPGTEVAEFVKQVRTEWFSLREYDFTPLSVIKQAAGLDRTRSLFETLVAVDHESFQHALESSDPIWQQRTFTLLERTGYPLALKVYGRPRVSIQLEFDRSRYSTASAGRILEHFVELLHGMTLNANTAVERLPFPGEQERRAVLVDWNRTETEYPRDVPLAELVERQVARRTDAVAVVHRDDTITYRDLNARANRLASVLRDRGAGPDVLVGVCVERSIELVVALLAVVKAGAGYLPLDPLLPPDRLKFMLDDSGARLVVAHASTQERLREFSGTVVNLSEALAQVGTEQNTAVAVRPEHLAYVIYTSGSTGKPKGAAILRGAFINFLWSMGAWLKMTDRDRFLALTTISFDIAGLELWLPLLVGGTVVVASRDAAADGWEVAQLVAKHDITFMFATPVSWRLVLEAGWTGKADLCAVCGGEAMSPDLAARLVPVVRELWNFYGPTETTVASTGCLVLQVQNPVPIGRPLANTRCYILDAHCQPVPVGVTAELYIGGDGLARGYLNRPELTAEKFPPDPFSDVPGARMYRTGDLARYRPDGNIECLGRTDHQVKIRGFRIEPGEIEARLTECDGVAQSVVVARDDAGRERRLVGYVVPKPGSTLNASRLKEQLRATLPEYMVPGSLVILNALPLTPNGKIDRAALPPPDPEAQVTADTYRAPRNPVEFALAAAWAEVLGLDRVGIDDNFFDLGGDSLLSVALLSRVLTLFPGTQPSLTQLLQAPTAAEFAKLVGRAAVPVDIVVKVREGKSGRAPFFCIPGVGGNILSLRPLALAMPDDVPFYCLQAKGLDGSEPFVTVEDTARCYAEHIRRIQPSGPYHLGGACYGGLVAFETARLLEVPGESVHVLALIDTRNAAYASSLPLHKLLAMNLRYYLSRTRHHIRQLAHLSATERRARLKSRTRTAFRLARELAGLAVGSRTTQLPDVTGLPFVAGDSELTQILIRVRNASLQAASTFVPSPYRGRILLFQAQTQEPQVYEDGAMGWTPVAPGGITSVEVPGDHDTILVEPRVRAIAGSIAAALEECTSRQQDA